MSTIENEPATRRGIADRLRAVRRRLRNDPGGNNSVNRGLLREYQTQGRIAQYFRHADAKAGR